MPQRTSSLWVLTSEWMNTEWNDGTRGKMRKNWELSALNVKSKNKAKRKREEEEEEIIELESPSIVGNQFWVFKNETHKHTDEKQHNESEIEKYQLNWKWIVNHCTGNISLPCMCCVCCVCAVCIEIIIHVSRWALGSIISCIYNFIHVSMCVCVVVLSVANFCARRYTTDVVVVQYGKYMHGHKNAWQ